jgi:class 3 adenylate cyclase
MTRHALKYFACMLSSGAVIAAVGGAAAYSGHHAADLPGLFARVLIVMGAVCFVGAWWIYRPVELYLSSDSGRAPPARYIRRIPLLSGIWVFVLAAATIGGHLGSSHGSWRMVAAAGPTMLATMLLNVATFAIYIALFAFFLVKEYLVGLRAELWASRGVMVQAGGGRIAARIFAGIVAVAVAPALLFLSDHAVLAAPMPQTMPEHDALLRQALDLNLFAAALFTVVLIFLVTRAVSRPIQILLDAMQRVDRGDLASRAPIVSDDEFGTLTARFNAMLEGLAQQERMRRTFGRFVPEAVAAALLAQEGAIAPQERVATVLFTDIEGFTQIASELQPRQVLGMLNDYFGSLAAIIDRHGGVVTQFQGDAVLAVFNLPAPLSGHAQRALNAGIEILRVMPRTRVGISTGRVVGGTVGGGERLGYTVHGDTVNLAARLEAMNKELGSRLLIDGRTAERLEGRVPLHDRGAVPIRGLPVPIRVFEPLAGEAVDSGGVRVHG